MTGFLLKGLGFFLAAAVVIVVAVAAMCVRV